jgi:hypothetical protein
MKESRLCRLKRNLFMNRARVIVAEFQHETNAFCPV